QVLGLRAQLRLALAQRCLRALGLLDGLVLVDRGDEQCPVHLAQLPFERALRTAACGTRHGFSPYVWRVHGEPGKISGARCVEREAAPLRRAMDRGCRWSGHDSHAALCRERNLWM